MSDKKEFICDTCRKEFDPSPNDADSPFTCRDCLNRLSQRDLNIRLAIHFLGVKKVYYGESDTPQLNPAYTPSGKPWRTHRIDSELIPNFCRDLNACVVHIIPKLAYQGYVVTVGSYEHRGYYAYAYYFLDKEPEAINDDNPALALSLAIDELIDTPGYKAKVASHNT